MDIAKEASPSHNLGDASKNTNFKPKIELQSNKSTLAIGINILIVAFALFVNGFGVYLTIHASFGASPWDVLNLGLSNTFGILYGTASIAVSVTILIIDILLKEPIGIAMFIDAVVVGKSVDFFNYIKIIPDPNNIPERIAMMFIGLIIIGYTQFLYMQASLGCGPRDTLLVGIKKRLHRIPIGLISIILLSTATFIGYLLGGPVGVGTLICAFCSGPIMQFAFKTVKFDATKVQHQKLHESFAVIAKSKTQ